jgi:hypothetical protein
MPQFNLAPPAHAGDLLCFNGEDLRGWQAPFGDWTVAGDAEPDPANSNRFRIRAVL